MKKNYFVTDHQYINTGGNCMVSIFSVYEKQQNVTRFIILNEEGANYQTADTISGDLRDNWEDDYDSFILFDFTWDALAEQRRAKYSIDKELIELMIECRFEYLKKDCAYFKSTVNVTYDELPQNLLNTLDPEAVAWHIEHEQYFTTNGYEVKPSIYYQKDSELQAAIRFRRELAELTYADSEKLAELMYNDINITIGDLTVKIPLHADTYSLFDKFMEDIIKEW